MSARRNKRRRDWPRGLYEPRPGYYVWRHPDGRPFALGRIPLADAINEAIAGNRYLSDHKPGLVERIAGFDHTVADLLAKLPAAKRPNSAKQYRHLDRIIRAAWGAWPVPSVAVRDVAALLEAQGGKLQTARMLRSRCVKLFRRGMALGWCESNPAEATETPAPVVRRGRLTLETWQLVRSYAPAWFQHAMDVALVLGVDESTLATLTPSMADGQALTYMRGKTSVWVAVPLALRLDVAGLALRDLLPHLPITNPDPHGNAGPMTGPVLSRAFTHARALAGLPSAREGGPSFHEQRSLAKRLYDQQGDVDTVALLGHLDAKTGEIYANPRGIAPLQVRYTPQVNAK